MPIHSTPRDPRTLIAAASLITAPLLMAIGDLLHPEERMAPHEQIAIVVDHASYWYTAHLLLLLGILLFIPGFLALSDLAGARRPAAGYAARILVLVGTAALASIFVGEMLVGRFVLDGADPAAATDLLKSMFSGPMVGALGPALLGFFVGVALFAIPLIRAGSTLGWAAAIILVGTWFILAEILSARVILSQVGNVLVFCGSATIAWLMLRGATGEPA
ncbi:MAG TPA: hypothetical protein VH680_08995 [Gemmatimonadales bacterium]|jgi:hypothetical protein